MATIQPRIRNHLLGLSLILALSGVAHAQDIRAGYGLVENTDSLWITQTIELDTTLLDSLIQAKAPAASGGRTYVNGPNIDSTGALYTVSGVQDWTTQINFSNSTSGGDSSQLVFSSSTGLLLPVAAGRRLTFELCQVKTNYTGGGGSFLTISFPAHVLGSSDTAFVSVHLIASGTSPRRYWLRLYKSKQADLSGLAPNLVDATKVYLTGTELDPLTVGYFPPTTTSFQARFTLRAKWLP